MTETAKKKQETLDDTTVMSRIKALMARLAPKDAELVTDWFVVKYSHPATQVTIPTEG